MAARARAAGRPRGNAATEPVPGVLEPWCARGGPGRAHARARARDAGRAAPADRVHDRSRRSRSAPWPAAASGCMRHPASGFGSSAGLWLFLIGVDARRLAGDGNAGRRRAPTRAPMRLAAPALFGIGSSISGRCVVIGFGVPQILLPAPQQIGHQLVAQAAHALADDFQQTFLKSVLAGFAAGLPARASSSPCHRPGAVPAARAAAARQPGERGADRRHRARSW